MIAMNDYSLNETASRARLAARGAGYHWGLADEVYRSVFWLIQRSLPAPLMLKKLLGLYESPNDIESSMPVINDLHCSARGAVLCPVMLGCALSDQIDATKLDLPITFDELVCPLLLLPFIAELASKSDQVAFVSLDSTQFAIDGKHLRSPSENTLTLASVKSGSIRFSNRSKFEFNTDDVLPLCERVNVDISIWQALDELAHHTYAPATEASRNSGAGAGVSDND